jgi:hypothetical protein
VPGVIREGDVVRLASGTYPLPSRESSLVVDRARVTWEGGWDDAFSTRDPFGTPSVLTPAPGFTRPVVEVTPAGWDVVLDGLTLDGGPGNTYGTAGLVLSLPPRQPPLLRIRWGRDVVVRNCVFLNGPGHGISAGVATKVMVGNSLLVNTRISALTAWGLLQGASLDVLGNTVMAVWAETPGGAQGDAVDLQPSLDAQLRGNVVLACQGHAFRVGLGSGTTLVERNALGPCGRGAAVGWPRSDTPVSLAWDALPDAAFLDARGNVLLSATPPLDPTGAAILAGASTATAAPAKAGGGAPSPPHAPRFTGPLVQLVGFNPSAGAQPLYPR